MVLEFKVQLKWKTANLVQQLHPLSDNFLNCWQILAVHPLLEIDKERTKCAELSFYVGFGEKRGHRFLFLKWAF